MTEIIILIAGALAGFIGKAVLQFMAQRHETKKDTDIAKENVKQILDMMLRHKTYTDRSFAAIRRAIGGFDDDELRKLLHEVGARQCYKFETEWWYLTERSMERIRNRKQRQKKS